jgi:hypothetical protein
VGEDLVVTFARAKSPAEGGVVGITLGVDGVVLGRQILGGSPGFPIGWVIKPEMMEAQGFPTQRGQGLGAKLRGACPADEAPR